METIGIIEDDENIMTTLKIGLQSFGYQVDSYPSAENFLAEHPHKSHTLLIIDLNLPRKSGIELCKDLRGEDAGPAILILTARTDEATAVECLRAGADDFVRKPFGFEELRARVDRLIARKHGRTSSKIRFHDLTLDQDSMHIFYQNSVLNLTPSEYEIMVIFLSNPENAFTRESLLQKLDPEADIRERTLDSHISRLRQKLKNVGCNDLKINSIYGTGYRLQWVRGDQ